MTVWFLDLKYNSLLNSSYSLEDGRNNLDFDKVAYSVGDEVNLFIEIPAWQYLAISDCCSDKKVDTRASAWDRNYISIEFTIKRKKHTLSHVTGKRAHLAPSSKDIYLQPISWGHEDLFKWICMGEIPTWITADEIKDYQSGHDD